MITRNLFRPIVSILLVLVSTSLQATTLVINNVRLVDLAENRIQADSALRIDNGFITAVGASGEFSQLEDARHIDAASGYLMPGLAEMHAHVPNVSDPGLLQDTLILYLAHGVTTIRGMLGHPDHLILRRQLAAAEVPGPRLITAGPSFNGNSVTSPEAARDMVRQQAEAGYDFLKLHPGLWPEAFAAISESADALGISFAGHVSEAVGIERALAARQHTVDHLDAYMQALVPETHPQHGEAVEFFGINLALAADPERIEALARRTAEAGVWNVPTETLMVNIAGERSVAAMLARPAMAYIDADTRAQWEERVRQSREQYSEETRRTFLDIRRQLLLALHQSGAGILLGADAPQIMNVPGHAVHEELALYVAAGLTPAEALATGTINVARFLGESGHGCLQPGCVADLLLLNADPLQDISHSTQIEAVMRAGRWFDRETLDEMLEGVAGRAAQR